MSLGRIPMKCTDKTLYEFFQMTHIVNSYEFYNLRLLLFNQNSHPTWQFGRIQSYYSQVNLYKLLSKASQNCLQERSEQLGLYLTAACTWPSQKQHQNTYITHDRLGISNTTSGLQTLSQWQRTNWKFCSCFLFHINIRIHT